jgi:hypothetical protein
MGRFSDIGAAVIGSGFIGTVHIENLRRLGVNAKGVLGSSPDRGAEAAARIGLPQAYTSLQELLVDPAVHAVHVTSPTSCTTRRSSRSWPPGYDGFLRLCTDVPGPPRVIRQERIHGITTFEIGWPAPVLWREGEIDQGAGGGQRPGRGNVRYSRPREAR